jgi:DNA-binding GntR family transcriptional regulator
VESSSAAQPPRINRTAKLLAIRARDKLVDLLEKRDAAAAEALWREHFDVTREVMLRYQPTKAVQTSTRSR